MTRFIGDSFKITPIHLSVQTKEGKSIETLHKISELIKTRQYNNAQLPNAGWVPFQHIKSRESLIKDLEINPISLPNKTQALPTTAVVDRIDARLRNTIPPNEYLRLPATIKYNLIPLDFVFYQNKKLFCLISATSQKPVDVSIKEFLNNAPFTDKGFVIDKNPADFVIASDLILWLIFKNMEHKGKINNEIVVSDIHLLDGQLQVPISLNYKGHSTPEYLEELQYSISKKRAFNILGLTLKLGKDLFQFVINTSGCVEFKPSECEYFEDEKDENLRNLAKLVQIFNVIIPSIKKIYQEDEAWQKKDREFFRQKCAAFCTESLDKQYSKKS